ncbi:hypothetical protein TNCV_749571 [Trichonephila clavipes]|nr:hypothetical protein TNCV_749571 [Trichonephila clavipes]
MISQLLSLKSHCVHCSTVFHWRRVQVQTQLASLSILLRHLPNRLFKPPGRASFIPPPPEIISDWQASQSGPLSWSQFHWFFGKKVYRDRDHLGHRTS